jgi:hypothetical protein
MTGLLLKVASMQTELKINDAKKWTLTSHCLKYFIENECLVPFRVYSSAVLCHTVERLPPLKKNTIAKLKCTMCSPC